MKKLMSIKKAGAVFALALMVSVFTVGVASAATPPQLQLEFNMEELFTYAQLIIGVMMPILYITLGISLGFLVIRALKGAFS